MALSGMRGLSVFISDVRNCQNKEQETLRVDKELGNIRTRFKNEKGLTPYEKKKYVWKMLYIYMLGYDVDFGHMEAVSLISAPKYPEKQVGYIVTSCLLNENHDFLRLAINAARNDIVGRNETFQCLALTMVGNIGGREFSESLAPDVQKLLVNVKLRIPAVLNKFLQPMSVSAEEFFPQWRSLSGPPLKIQEVVGGVSPLPLLEMVNLLSSYRLTICPGLDPNPNNLVASTTFYSESTRAMLCLVRIETDPADRTQLRMTVASGDPALTFEMKEFVKEQLVSIPKVTHVPTHQPPPASTPATLTDPGAMLAALLYDLMKVNYS